MRKKTLFLLLAGVFVIAFLFISGLGYVDFAYAVTDDNDMQQAIVNVANTTGKAVVSISTETTTKLYGGRRYYFGFPEDSPFGEDEFIRRFFDDLFGVMPEREFKHLGLGSGVIIDANGYILTNEHVIGQADKIMVTLADGRQFKGEIKGKDPHSDLAVIKINANNLPYAILGDSDNLKIGQWVVAIGNPFGFVLQNPEPTVTVGVISALHRSLGRAVALDKDYNDLIQTDAAINPGNSGGPLVNLKGEVIGINVAIFSTSGGYQGIGFAVPINKTKRILSQLIAGKKITYGWLGVTVQDLNEDLMQYFGLTEKTGALVVKVVSRSPAEKAGIKEGDVIKSLDGKSINSVRDLLACVGATEVGRKVKIGLVREKRPITLEVIVGERPEKPEEMELAREEENIPVSPWRGIRVKENRLGVVVISVEPNSPADLAGIIPQDVIVEINKFPVRSLADYKNIIGQLKGNVLVKTLRGYFLIRESAR